MREIVFSQGKVITVYKILHAIQTDSGAFVVRTKDVNSQWEFSNVVIRFHDGTIYWWTHSPKGVLIQYPDGVRRFISDDWMKENPLTR